MVDAGGSCVYDAIQGIVGHGCYHYPIHGGSLELGDL